MSQPSAKVVFCVRNERMKAAKGHLECPYCYAKALEEIESGERARFCDFDPEKDPTSFGFPEGTSRNLKG